MPTANKKDSPSSSSSPTQEVTSTLLTTPLPVPTHGPGGSFTILAKTLIRGTPKAILDVVRNTNTWKEWNTFCPACSIPSTSSTTPSTPPAPDSATDRDTEEAGWLKLGTAATITYVLSGAPNGSRGEQGIEVTFCDYDFVSGDGRRGARIAWKATGRSYWMLHSERVMTFLPVHESAEDGKDGEDNGGNSGKDGGWTEYTCWETFGGSLAGTVRLTVGQKLKERFGDYARDLKGFVEGGGRGGGEGT